MKINKKFELKSEEEQIKITLDKNMNKVISFNFNENDIKFILTLHTNCKETNCNICENEYLTGYLETPNYKAQSIMPMNKPKNKIFKSDRIDYIDENNNIYRILQFNDLKDITTIIHIIYINNIKISVSHSIYGIYYIEINDNEE